MAESNATQVILTDDGLKIINAQTTADNAASGVINLNDSSKLGPAEKQELSRKYRADKALYNIDMKMLTDAGLPTTDLQSAMTALDSFITPYFQDMGKTEKVSRDQLNQVFTGFDTADKNASSAFNDMISNAANDAKKAGDDAKEVGEKAQEAGEAAKQAASQAQADATQAKADATTAQQKAQSSIDQLNDATTKFDGEITDAKNSAQKALDNITVVDSKVDKLSSSTTAQFDTLNNGYQEVISTVNNMDIGGRNIVLDSDNMGSFDIWRADGNSKLSDDKKEITITTSHGGINIRKKNLSEYLPNKGDTIVISADVKGNSHLQFNYNDGNGFVGSGTNIAVTTDYKRYSTTFEWNPVNLDKTEFVVYAAGSAGQYLTIKNVKVEIGNKGTDWSPAPEDFASQTQITTLNNLIDQKVSNDKYQSDQIQTANLIASKVSTVDFNNLTISNRNLALGTATPITMTGNGSTNNVKRLYSTSGTISKGTTVTIAFDITSTNTTGKFAAQFVGGSWQGPDMLPLTAGTQHCSYTLVANNNYSNGIQMRLDNSTSTVTVSNFIISESSKEVSWSPAPEDLATSTEIDQLNNAIKLKANSSDVTSQINVAIQGVQTDVTNKVSNLTTQINQTSDAVQILATTGGQKNLVYNSSYANNAEGWNTFNKTGYLSTLAVLSYNGSPGFGVGVSGKSASAWTIFGKSKLYTLPQPDTVATENTYSGSAMIKMYDDSDGTAQLSATLAYYDKDGARISGWKDMIVSYDSKDVWKEVKFENLPIPKGAYSIGMEYWAYGPKVHGMIAQPMIVFGPKIGQYQPDVVSQSDITASIDNIHLGVKNADGSTSTFNMNGNTILLDANKIILNGNTSIQNGTIGTAKIANAAINTAQIADGAINNAKIANAAINDAKISNLNGNKIIAGSITSQQLNADDIIANVINGKTINGITINTPNLNLGTNGVLNEDWNLNQNTAWFEPKKGTGTTTLDMGVLRMSGNLSRWWDGSGSDQYWYGIGDNGDKIKDGSNSVTDDYAPGYEKHDIVGSSGVLLRSYLDATGLYLNQNSTKTVMAALTQKGLDTGGYIHAMQNSVVDKWFDAGVDAGTGIRIGYRAIQAHNSNDIYFNTDSSVGALTLHAKNFAASSQLSRKKDISPLEEEQAMETIMNTDIYRYHYKEETESEPYNYSVIIDDVHEKPQYKTPEEFIIADRTGRNDGNAVGFLIQALKNANRRISALEEIINERK